MNLLFFDMLEALKNSEILVKWHGGSLAYSFSEFLKANNMSKKQQIHFPAYWKFSRLTDWIFPAYYWNTPENYLTPPICTYWGEPSLKKNGKIWEKFPRGGGFEKNRRKFPISIWEFWKPRGDLDFSKMSEFQIFDSVVCNITFII